MILLDTDIFIDYFRDYGPGVAFFHEHSEEIALSEFTVMELLIGCENQQQLKWMLGFTDQFYQVSASPSIMTKAIHILTENHLKNGVNMNDALIAATAIDMGIHLYSRNQKHFKCIKNLTFYKPYN